LEFNFDLNLVQSQKLLLTPQLKQALEVLRMNSLELNEYLEEQVEANLVLEIIENEDGDDENTDDLQEDMEAEYRTDRIEFQEQTDEALEYVIDKSPGTMSLKEYLMFQLNTSGLNSIQKHIGEYLIGNTDENGYLLVGIPETALHLNVPTSMIAVVLQELQSFEPPGVCARNLKECLLIQLRQLENIDEEVINIVSNHLDALAANKIAAVAKNTGLSLHRVCEVLEFIKTMEPKPGRAFAYTEEIKYVNPDIIVKKLKDKFEVLINEDSVTPLKISTYYKKMITEDISSETRKFIQNKIDSALWVIKCIEERKNTVRKISECIVNKQLDFFDKGKRYLKPLNMKTVAKETGMHESTVSRAVNGKYLQCTWGIFELKYFFPGKISTVSGEDVSIERIKLKLKQIVETEDKINPLSDSEISAILGREGMGISRRTVAKYRAILGISPADKRRKY